MAPLAYLPRYEWEVGASVLGAFAIAFGFWHLATGRGPEPGLRRRTVRLAGFAQILFGAGAIAAAFLIDAEPPDQPPTVSHWGDTSDLVVFAVWLALLCGLVAWILRKYLRGR